LRKEISKRGQVFNIGLIFVVLFVLTTAGIVLQGKANKFQGVIGEQQFELIKGYQAVEKAQYFIERLGILSLSDSITKLAEQGGFSEASECGMQSDTKLNLWSMPEEVKSMEGSTEVSTISIKTCFPFTKDKKESISTLLKQELKKEIQDPILTLFVPNSEPIIEVKEKSIAYKSINTKPITFDIGVLKTTGKTAEKPIAYQTDERVGKYTIKPTFKVELPYSFAEYEQAKELAQQAIDKCAKEPPLSIIGCIYIAEEGKEHLYGKDCEEVNVKDYLKYNKNRVYPICYRSKQFLLKGAPNIKFGLMLPDQTKPELGLETLFTGGILNIKNLFNLNLVRFDIKELNLYDMLGSQGEFKRLLENDLFEIPNYNPDKEYIYELDILTSTSTYKSKIVVKDGQATIVK